MSINPIYAGERLLALVRYKRSGKYSILSTDCPENLQIEISLSRHKSDGYSSPLDVIAKWDGVNDTAKAEILKFVVELNRNGMPPKKIMRRKLEAILS